jgi:hypothetical protein
MGSALSLIFNLKKYLHRKINEDYQNNIANTITKKSWNVLVIYLLLNVSASSNIVRIIKSGRIRWTGRVAIRGKKVAAYRDLVGKP